MSGALGTVAHYDLRHRLGAGGMGEVYLAHDQRLDRLVAIKFLTGIPAGDDARRRLRHEAQALAALDHPNICAVYEVGTDAGGRDFIVMQYVEGETLAARIQRGPMGVETALELIGGIAEALRAAHEHGVIHRDLKPQNVVLTGGGIPKLLDFGIAQMEHADEGTTTVSRLDSGGIAGTPGYIAPEVLQGRPADARSDLFSMGVVLYECLTGIQPFRGGTPHQVMHRVINVDPDRPSRANTTVSAGLDAVCHRLLAKEPGRRFQSAAEVCGALQVLLAEPQRAPPGRRRVLVAAGILVAVGLTAAAVNGPWRTTGAVLPPAPPAAREWYLRAIEAIRQGALVSGRKALEEAVRLYPDYALAHSRLAEVLSALDEERAAQRALLRVGALVPDQSRLPVADRLRLDAIRAMVLRDFPRAIAAYTELSKTAPQDAGALLDLGRAQEAAGQLTAARRSYEQATALNSQLATGFLRLGSVLGDTGDLAEALTALSEAERLYGVASNVEGRVETLLRRGATLDSAGHFDETATAAAEASRLAQQAGLVPQMIRAGFQSGSAQVGAGQFAAGAATTRTYVNSAVSAGLQGTAADGLIDMAGTLLVGGRLAEADAALVQARAIADERSLTRTAMRASTQRAALELRQDQPAEALALLDEPLRYFAQSRHRRLEAVALTIAARAHQSLGHYAEASALLELVLAFAAESQNDELRAQAESSLATLAGAQGHLPEALEHRATAIRLRRALGDTETLPYDLTNHAETLIRLGQGAAAAALLDEIEAGITAGTGAFPTRVRRVATLRAWQAVTEGRYAAARQHLAALTRGASAAGGGPEAGAALLDALAAAALRKPVRIPSAAPVRGPASADARELQLWRVMALAASSDTAQARAEITRLLQEPAPASDEIEWRISATAAALASDAALARRYAGQSRDIFARLEREWRTAIATYRGRKDVAALLNTITPLPEVPAKP